MTIEREGSAMLNTKLTMVYWKSKKFWLGKLAERPEIMTQGRTVKELEENIQEAYRMMVMEDVPEKHQVKAVLV
jgi:predicted RNase H-like HicB family nuclease